MRSSALPISSSMPCRSKIGRGPPCSSIRAAVAGMNSAAKALMRACSAGGVDQHAGDAAGQLIAQDAQRQRQILMHQRAGGQPAVARRARAARACAGTPYPRAGSRARTRLRRGAQDVAAVGLGAAQLRDRRLQALALRLVLDPRRHADALAPRQVHEEARGQRDVGRQARSLGADRVLDHLHQDVIARVSSRRTSSTGGAPSGASPTTVSSGGGLAMSRRVQECGALQADVDEGRLHARQHAASRDPGRGCRPDRAGCGARREAPGRRPPPPARRGSRRAPR